MSMISELVEKLRRYARFSKVNNPSWSGAMTEAADTIEALSEKVRTQNRCPVGGVDRSEEVDKISIQNAVETPFWMAIWATEPERPIDVRMSYSDLKVICDLIDKVSGVGEGHV